MIYPARVLFKSLCPVITKMSLKNKLEIERKRENMG
jgi:hypothetical protein